MAGPGNQHCASCIGTLLYSIVDSLMTTLCTGCGRQKKYPLKIFGNISPTSKNFQINVHTPIVCLYLRNTTQCYSVIYNFDNVMPYEGRPSSEFLHFTRKTWKIAMSLQQYDLSPQNLARWCTTDRQTDALITILRSTLECHFTRNLFARVKFSVEYKRINCLSLDAQLALDKSFSLTE